MAQKTRYRCVVLAPLVVEVEAETPSQAVRLARRNRHVVAADLRPPLRLTADGKDLTVLSVAWGDDAEERVKRA